MSKSIFLSYNGERFMLATGRGIFPTKFIPDVVGCVASSFRQNGILYGHDGMDERVYEAIKSSAMILSERPNYGRPLFIGFRPQEGQPAEMALMEASYGKKNIRQQEVFDDKRKFMERVKEIVIDSGVSIILNTGIENGDLPLEEDDYAKLIDYVKLKATEVAA